MMMFQKGEQLLHYETKGKDYTVVTGYFNAVVGEGKEDAYVGHYGLGYLSNCRQMLQKTSIHMDEAWRRDGIRHNILTNCRYWSVCNAKAYPGDAIDSDHNNF